MVKIDNEKCSGCGNCVDACIDAVLVIKDVAGEDSRIVVENPEDCDGCGDCEMACPNDAIIVDEE